MTAKTTTDRFRRKHVEHPHFVVHLDNLEDRDGAVMASVSGKGARAWAENQQSIGGSSWEGAGDDHYAYAMPTDHPGLVAELEKEGYELDLSEYTPPTPEEQESNSAKRNEDAEKIERILLAVDDELLGAKRALEKFEHGGERFRPQLDNLRQHFTTACSEIRVASRLSEKL